MSPYFDSLEKQEVLRIEAESWLGTPFFPHSAAKGADGGVDCVNLMYCILYNTKAVGRLNLPDYPMDWGEHQSESVIERFMSLPGIKERFVKLPASEHPLPGDLFGFRVGHCVHHLGLCLPGNRFIHCMRPYGVQITSVDERAFIERLSVIYRPIQLNI